VAGSTYVINPKTNSVRQAADVEHDGYTAIPVRASATCGSRMDVATFSVQTSGDGQANIVVNGKQLDPKAVAELVAKAKAEGRSE
jgi:hypothetical protein